MSQPGHYLFILLLLFFDDREVLHQFIFQKSLHFDQKRDQKEILRQDGFNHL